MAIRTELTVRLQNMPGALSRLCQALADERVNILALSLEPTGTLRLLADNPVHAAGVLRDRHYHIEERDVLYTVAPNDPGSLARIAALLAAEGVNLEYLYTTSVEDSTMAGIVAGVPDAARASAAAGL
jgi:hypothetical protein